MSSNEVVKKYIQFKFICSELKYARFLSFAFPFPQVTASFNGDANVLKKVSAQAIVTIAYFPIVSVIQKPIPTHPVHFLTFSSTWPFIYHF